jgi:hypothetical protein
MPVDEIERVRHVGASLAYAILHANDADGRGCFPAASGEVGEVHGTASAGHRFLAQLRDAAPGGGVVDVDVRDRAAAAIYPGSTFPAPS